MVEVQLEDGYTKIANAILENLAKLKLSNYGTRIVLCIIRKTYGWHKKEDYITHSQITSMTGIKKPNVSRGLKELINRNLVIKRGNKRHPLFSFQKDYEKWVWKKPTKRCVIKVDNTSSRKRGIEESLTKIKELIALDNKDEVVIYSEQNDINSDNSKSPKQLIEKGYRAPKETIQKKTPRVGKKKTNSEIKKFIDTYFNGYKNFFNEAPEISGGKDGNLIKQMLTRHSLKNLVSLLPLFWQLKDDLIKKNGHTIGMFKLRLNKLVELRKEEKKRWWEKDSSIGTSL